MADGGHQFKRCAHGIVTPGGNGGKYADHLCAVIVACYIILLLFAVFGERDYVIGGLHVAEHIKAGSNHTVNVEQTLVIRKEFSAENVVAFLRAERLYTLRGIEQIIELFVNIDILGGTEGDLNSLSGLL